MFLRSIARATSAKMFNGSGVLQGSRDPLTSPTRRGWESNSHKNNMSSSCLGTRNPKRSICSSEERGPVTASPCPHMLLKDTRTKRKSVLRWGQSALSLNNEACKKEKPTERPNLSASITRRGVATTLTENFVGTGNIGMNIQSQL